MYDILCNVWCVKMREEKQNWSVVFFIKIILFYDDNLNQLRQLTRDQNDFKGDLLRHITLQRKKGEVK